MTQGTWEPKT